MNTALPVCPDCDEFDCACQPREPERVHVYHATGKCRCGETADVEPLIAWLADADRQPAVLAFPDGGPERRVAYYVETALEMAAIIHMDRMRGLIDGNLGKFATDGAARAFGRLVIRGEE